MPTAVITGANRGLGLELSRQYIEDGWQVYAINRSSSDAMRELMKSNRLVVIDADLTNDDSLRAAAAQVDVAAIDLLVNNAGMMGDGSFAEIGFSYQTFGTFDRDEWHRIFDINICTPMALTELLVDKLEAADLGCVVTLSSELGSNEHNTMGNFYPYRASKAAVNSMMKSMGYNLKDRGIVAVAIQPGWVRTDMGGPKGALEAGDSIRGVRETLSKLTLEDNGKLFNYDGEEAPY
jgi:NAD(P)-dependent dehydrogenase (short-subunit alcohol dehydrogenase family)